MMKIAQTIRNIFANEDLNFLLTNRIPRHALTVFIGWFSKIESAWIRDLSIFIWRIFTDLDLSEAKKTQFKSLHDCFIRELKEGARPINDAESVLISPSDGIVGECGIIKNGQVFQAKGFPYQISDLLGSHIDPVSLEGGVYVTLRLTSAMYHRFHAPYSGVIDRVVYHSGDTWNVNPVALKRIENLFCKNERAAISMQIAAGRYKIYLVPVAAILVASIRLHGLDVTLNSHYRGSHHLKCALPCVKGEQLGWFEHGSTIILFAPSGFSLAPNIANGITIKMGTALFQLPPL
ncbi:archaetidylserine decarboxylase [Zwartia panacis]|uniref:archaetidylserine decarboxylase n=1 Tax=Zwartia panacis TaxID=2683345 RepID=UPI0025B376D9|nr:archaetidylserine decarboxylase [Zwartia panacis]MDN4017768.1 archaetidylserine decarboxylase [Zwartia panacis]